MYFCSWLCGCLISYVYVYACVPFFICYVLMGSVRTLFIYVCLYVVRVLFVMSLFHSIFVYFSLVVSLDLVVLFIYRLCV